MKENFLYKLDRFIISLFFTIAIFIPLIIGSFENDKVISEVEKRALSQLPGVPHTFEEVKVFPQVFEKYYADHFGLRDLFINYYNLVKYRLGDSPSEDVTIGKNGWLFLGSVKKGYMKYMDPIGDFRNVNLYSQQELKRFAKYMVTLNAWLNEKGIKYVFVIAPNKHTIYFEQLPDYISKVSNRSASDQLIEYIKAYTDIRVVDLRGKLMKAKKMSQLYYKTDTHWNHFAANIAQYEIMVEIEKLFPNQIQPAMQELITVNSIGKCGDLANFIGINICKEHEVEPIFRKACAPSLQPLGVKSSVMRCEGQNLNTVIFRDSFFNYLVPYFSRKFKQSTYLWEKLNYTSLMRSLASDKPDIIIEEWVERTLPHLPNGPMADYLLKYKYNESNSLIFSIDGAMFEFNESLNLVDDKDGNLRFRATALDPMIFFPSVPLKSNNDYVFHINMTSSVQSTLQVFYSDISRIGYPFSEIDSLKFPVKEGDNDIYIPLAHQNIGKQLRLDPILGLGEITIKSFDIKRVEYHNFKE